MLRVFARWGEVCLVIRPLLKCPFTGLPLPTAGLNFISDRNRVNTLLCLWRLIGETRIIPTQWKEGNHLLQVVQNRYLPKGPPHEGAEPCRDGFAFEND